MSDLGPHTVSPSFTAWRSPDWRSRVAAPVTFWAVVAAGAGLTIAAVPAAIAFVPSAPGEFWVLAALALAAAFTPFRLPPPARRTVTFAVSACFCFAIALLFQTGPAIAVQALVAAVAAHRLALRWPSWALLTARLVCSLAVAGWVAGVLRASVVGTGGVHERPTFLKVLGVAGVAAVFLVVSLAITVLTAVLADAPRAELMGQLRIEAIAQGSVLLVGLVVVSTPTKWELALLVVPMIGWFQVARLLQDQEHRLAADPVTGLLSARGLTSTVSSLARGPDHERRGFLLIVVQLRGIPSITRTLGHGVAEGVVVAAAHRLRAAAKSGDYLGQLPDSQFVIVRTEHVAEDAMSAARRVVACLSIPIESEGVPFTVDPVAGVAVAPQHGQSLDELVAHAESALFDSGVQHDEASEYTPEAASEVDDRLAVLRDLSAAVREPARASEIVMLYQPQVSLGTGQADGVEALFRWRHPERGLMPTDELMQLVEPTAVMQQLTGNVLDRVVGQLAAWNDAGYSLRATVNVSVLDLTKGQLETQVADVLERHGVPANQLGIEITERSLVETPGVLDEAAHRVARLGVDLSIDDFGTGFASLHLLRNLPLAELKIDRSFVSQVRHNQGDRAIVASMHATAQALGLRLVAEGIEDEQTAHILADLDGVIGQGWLFARPMTSANLVDWLDERRPGSSSEASDI